ncbi:ATP-binding protein, partial [Celeribacter halophilus]
SDTRPAGGTGLGMHICRQILTQHNATISYKSTLGEGTTFIVKFKTGTA